MIFTNDHLIWCMDEARKAGLSYGQWRVMNPDTRDAYMKATGKIAKLHEEKPTKICPHCKKDFVPKNLNMIYCCVDCKIQFNREKGNERSKEYQRQLRARRKAQRSVFLESEEI